MKAMNALVAKEIRLLLPAYAAALVLAVLPVWFLPSYRSADPTFYILCAFWFGIVMLALSSFGREFGMKTFPLLLVQPLERRRVWWTKTAVLAGAITTVFLAWAISCAPRISRDWGTGTWSEAMAAGGLAAAALVAGGLCMTLLLRQVAAAFWFTILVPWAIVVVGGAWGIPDWVGYLALVAYTVAAFVWARWQFLNAQEVGWTGGTIALPGWRAGDATQSGNRSRRPLAALFWKELQLHQIGLAGMAGLFGLHLGVVAVRKFGGSSLSDMVKTGLDVFGGIWLLVPLLIGGTSVAEERKLGTMQAHLILPVSRKVQFLIKLLTVLLIGGLLSTVLLWTAEGIASDWGANCNVGFLKQPFTSDAFWTLCWVFLAWSLICFYASTLVSGLIQSLAASVLVAGTLYMLAILVAWVASFVEEGFVFLLVSRALFTLVAVPALVLTMVCLSIHNFKAAAENWRFWRRNLCVFLGVSLGTVVVTSSVYNRVWEFVMPEAAHGPARISSTNLPKLDFFNAESGRANVLTSDGKIWTRPVAHIAPRIWLGFQIGVRPLPEHGNHFVSGSNWTDAVSSVYETVALRDDGSLWVSEKPGLTWHLENGKRVYERHADSPLVQFGVETNWQRVVRDGWNAPAVVLLNQDGTLWRWGPTAERSRQDETNHNPWPGLRAFEPRRLGTESNWNRIIALGGTIYAWKSDGQSWIIYHSERQVSLPREVELEPGTVMMRSAFLDNFQFKSMIAGWFFGAGLEKDGSLWVWGGGLQRPTRIGTNSDWTSLAGENSRFVARKADGSLWEWDGRNGQALQDLLETPPTRLGNHNDWLAVATGPWSGVLALAADGSLWQWWNHDPRFLYFEEFGLNLRPPRRPSLMGNIFDDQPSP